LPLAGYSANRTGLLLIDPYNDVLSDGGKLWPDVKTIAESVDLLPHLRALVEAARRLGVAVFYVPHRRWREGNYDGWRHPGPGQTFTDRECVFGEGMWGGDWHPDLVPQPGDVVVQQHWGQNGFANTDLDLQLKQRGIERIIVAGNGGQHLRRGHRPLRRRARLSRDAGPRRDGGLQCRGDARCARNQRTYFRARHFAGR
jgi:Isochorismatase family